MKKIVNRMMAFLMASMFVFSSTIASYAYTPTEGASSKDMLTEEVNISNDTQGDEVSPQALITTTTKLVSIYGTIHLNVTYVVNDGTGVLVDIKSVNVAYLTGGVKIKNISKYISPDRTYGVIGVTYTTMDGKTYYEGLELLP